MTRLTAVVIGWATTIVVALGCYFGAAHLGLNTLLLLIAIALLLTKAASGGKDDQGVRC